MRDSSTFSVQLTDPDDADGSTLRGPSFSRRRRNRHGRGLRGPMIPPPLPGSRSRSERFDEWVMESAQRLERLWGDRILDLQMVVQDIPANLETMTAQSLRGLLGTAIPAAPNRPPTIIIYRHPVELAAGGFIAPNELVHDVVVEQTAELLGMAPEAVDPAYGRSRS
ncbi:metallopeptidase family protein [Arthrobacter flavus]|uniref:Metallopeptidase family protein n=1 Tax=Arthrobacter flavus TaxID=95172 RepID=A0ABW4Q8Y6_9MICC